MTKFKTLKDHVYDYIATQIMEGKLNPNQKINESVICSELSISRTPVREALIQLASEEILENVPRRGFVLKAVNSKEAREIYEVIGILDGLAAYNACDFLTDKDFLDMKFFIDSMELAINSENYPMYYKQQLEFHQTYISKCGNDILISELEKLRNKFLKRSYASDVNGEVKEILMLTNDEHREIHKMLKAHEKENARNFIASVHWSPEKSKFDLIGE